MIINILLYSFYNTLASVYWHHKTVDFSIQKQLKQLTLFETDVRQLTATFPNLEFLTLLKNESLKQVNLNSCCNLKSLHVNTVQKLVVPRQLLRLQFTKETNSIFLGKLQELELLESNCEMQKVVYMNKMMIARMDFRKNYALLKSPRLIEVNSEARES